MKNNNDFFLDEINDEEDYAPLEIDESNEDEDEDDSLEDSSGDDDDDSKSSNKLTTSQYDGKLTKNEVDFLNYYDDISKLSDNIEAAITILVGANPQHTSSFTINNIVKDIVNRQGHSRVRNEAYTSGPLRGDDVNQAIEGDIDDIDIEINKEVEETVKLLMDSFINYLSTRDLSEDSLTSRRRKQRQLPALIILMFSSNLYNYIMDCPSMPKDYQDQITYAFKHIQEDKNKILEDMCVDYEKYGRKDIADRIHEMGLSWFNKEPAEVLTAAEYRDLNLTKEDIQIYKKYRSLWANLTVSITQDVISNFIEVVIDSKKGIYEKLKDKTRSEAINDVKKEFKRWVSDYHPESSDLANKIFFNKL